MMNTPKIEEKHENCEKNQEEKLLSDKTSCVGESPQAAGLLSHELLHA